jgi:hypothetical protein
MKRDFIDFNEMNVCRQLEENINKWTLDLEDMEKVFLNQATQVPYLFP